MFYFLGHRRSDRTAGGIITLIKSMMSLTIFIKRMTERRIHTSYFMVDYYIKEADSYILLLISW